MPIARADLQKLSTYQDRLTSLLPPTIESAAVIAPEQFLSRVSGTVAISTIVPVTDGAHLICLVFTDSSPAAFLTTGNIGSAVTPTQNAAIFLMYDPVLGKYFPSSASSSAGAGIAQTSFLVTGGQVVWTSAYNFTVTAATYFINGVQYSSPQTDITLAAAHATLDRIDVVAVNSLGQVVVITGTAAAQPSEPDIDPGTQLKIGFVFVAASSTQPTVTSTLLYAENAGGPTEWNWAVTGVGFDVNSTNNPIPPSTKSIDGTNVAAAAYAEGTIPTGTINVAAYRLLVLPIRPKSQWSNNRGLTISFRNSAGVLLGLNVNINRSGTFGFDHTNINYQVVAIPIEQFGLAPTDLVSKIRITDFGGAINFNIDNVTLQQNGATQAPQTGLTQEEADARYLRLDTEDFIGVTVDGGGSVPATGIRGRSIIPYGFSVLGWALIADVAGSCVFDIWVDTYPNIPTIADTITAAAKPTLSAAQINRNITLTGWNKGPFPLGAAGEPRTVFWNLDSISTITWVALFLFIKKVNP